MISRSRALKRLADDPYLAPFAAHLEGRRQRRRALIERLTDGRMSLVDFASGHEFFGLKRDGDSWHLAEWAPSARAIFLVGAFSDWQERSEYAFAPGSGSGTWELRLPADALAHGDLFRLRVHWDGGAGDRIPAWARRVVQDDDSKIFNAQVWSPPQPHVWRHPAPPPSRFPLIYEAHVGMAQERPGIGSWREFQDNVLPRLIDAGYDTIQLMAVMEHPYYASFGYQVSSFFAASSRFGTPEELKTLIDTAHGAGLRVIMDLVHSHAVKNEVEGLSRYDGTAYQFFHDGPRGLHPAWDSRCFDYGKPEVLHFLLSNCRYWLDEYRFDGFRFDGITSMLYHHRGLGVTFDSYERYFDDAVDEDAVAYLSLANELIHTLRPDALTVAEDVSGLAGLAAPLADGGCGFDCRLAMGIPDCWFRLAKEVRDEDWNLGWLWHELINRRADERTVSYVECHDQAMVGGKTFIFELVDAAIYDAMARRCENLTVERGVALHAMARLTTLGTAAHGYLNFIGNEFGHPEWIDFPRPENGWSYHHARRQWSLRDDEQLRYHALAEFDAALMERIGRHADLASTLPELVTIHEQDGILAFRRGRLLFVCNFHPQRSAVDYGIPVEPGSFWLLLSSDDARFGGLGRIVPDQRFVAQPRDDAGNHAIRVYLPCRTALVVERRD